MIIIIIIMIPVTTVLNCPGSVAPDPPHGHVSAGHRADNLERHPKPRGHRPHKATAHPTGGPGMNPGDKDCDEGPTPWPPTHCNPNHNNGAAKGNWPREPPPRAAWQQKHRSQQTDIGTRGSA